MVKMRYTYYDYVKFYIVEMMVISRTMCYFIQTPACNNHLDLNYKLILLHDYECVMSYCQYVLKD